MKILVSACLLGVPCRYDGTGALDESVASLAQEHTLVPVCPEQFGGLPAPRQPFELCDGRAVTKYGEDVTRAMTRGAAIVVDLARLLGCTHAVFKQRSPSCGCGRIYDGTFQGRVIEGDGMATKALRDAGVTVLGEDSLEELP